MALWTIQHWNHSGTVLKTFTPAGDIEIQRNKNMPSSISYNLARSDPQATVDCAVPYVQDFHLFRDNVRIMSGPITQVEWDDSNEGVIQVSGQTWLHLLERRVAPVNLSAMATYKAWGGESLTPVTKLGAVVKQIMTLVDAEPYAGLSWIVDETDKDGVLSNIPTDYAGRLAALDGQTILDFIKAVGDRDDGFDFEGYFYDADPGMGTTARLVLFYPRREKSVVRFQFAQNTGNVSTDMQFATFKWTNSGPSNTKMYALGQTLGKSSGIGDVLGNAPPNGSTLPYIKDYVSGSQKYRLLEEQIEFGNVADLTMLKKLADVRAKTAQRELHDIDVTIDTQAFPHWWTDADPGDIINVVYDLGFHKINSNYRINSYTATISENGDESVRPDLERIWL